MSVGTYDEGEVRTPGTFSATPGIAAGLKGKLVDAGDFYASKDFYDPVKKRRINWGWATVPPASVETLPREVTWHPELEQLVHAPVEEQDSLRDQEIGGFDASSLAGDGSSKALGLPTALGNTSEIMVSFERPTFSVKLAVSTMVGSDGSGSLFSVDYVHDPSKVSLVQVHGGPYTDTLQLLPSDTSIDLRLYVDNTMTEAFWMGGRVAMTAATPATPEADVEVSVSGAEQGSSVVATAKAWSVKSIWVSPEEVMGTPRPDAVQVVV